MAGTVEGKSVRAGFTTPKGQAVEKAVRMLFFVIPAKAGIQVLESYNRLSR